MPGVSGGSGGGSFSAAIIGGLMPATQGGWGTANSAKRRADSAHHRSQASNQRTIRTATLAGMEGKSAERLMKAHALAEVKHNVVADGHDVKASAYEAGNNTLEAVCSKLRHIDAEAHRQINEVLKKKTNFALKWAEIVKIVTEARADAVRAVADGVETTLSTLSRVLSDTGQDKSVNDVVHALDSKYQIDMPPSEPKMPPMPDEAGGTGSGVDGHMKAGPDDHIVEASSGTGSGELQVKNASSSTGSELDNLPAASSTGMGQQPAGPGANGLPAGGVLTAGGAPVAGAGGSAPRVPGSGVGVPSGGGSSSVPSVPEALTPAGLAKGFTTGMSTGAPAALESNAAASSVVNAASGGHVGASPAAAPVSGAGSVPVVSGGGSAVHHVDSGAVEHVSASAVSAPPPVVQPVVAAPSPVVGGPPPPVVPGGPLPAYAADVRAAAAAAAAPPAASVAPPVAPAPAGGSASTAPASGSTLNPAVVNKPAPPAAAGVGSSAGAAVTASATAGATTGAVAGAAAKASDAQRRCDDAVAALALQEPRLRWAAGLDDVDGQVLVVTDLAGGWLPGHVRPPAGVRLVEPSADVTAGGGLSLDMLLGKTAFRADYVPGGPVRDPRVELSDWPRKLEPVADVRWELRQAADWRDGLPRLAHTMAKAWATGNGVRPIEIDTLRDFISHTRGEVLRSYPGAVHPHTVGNWMLAAAIDAFNNGESLLGTYHFSWFRALCGVAQAA